MMTTMTIADRLLALAGDYEQKGKALRLAAAALNGEVVTQAQVKTPAVLAAAMKIRHAQKKKGRPPKRADTPEAREALVRQCLEGGPQTTRHLTRYLAVNGIRRSVHAIRDTLHQMADVELHGRTSKARWQLRAVP